MKWFSVARIGLGSVDGCFIVVRENPPFCPMYAWFAPEKNGDISTAMFDYLKVVNQNTGVMLVNGWEYNGYNWYKNCINDIMGSWHSHSPFPIPQARQASIMGKPPSSKTQNQSYFSNSVPALMLGLKRSEPSWHFDETQMSGWWFQPTIGW